MTDHLPPGDEITAEEYPLPIVQAEEAARREIGPQYETAERALGWLLTLAWGDLGRQMRQAVDGCWSCGCDAAMDQVIGLTKLVGPLPANQVSIVLVGDGTYQRVMAAAGYPALLTVGQQDEYVNLLRRYRDQG